jgi:hypothetical protein
MTIRIPEQKVKEQIPAGSYLARCYQMIHIGTNSFEWQGQTKTSNKVRITFELPTELKVFKEGDAEKPIVISAEYTLSLHEKSKLRPVLEGWRGKAFTDEEAKDFEISNLVGVPAMISIIHNQKGYAEISSISRIPKGMECPEQINSSQILSYDEWNEELFEKLPEFIKNKIKTSVEYRKMKGTYQENDETEIPVIEDDGIDIKNIPF